MALDSLLVLMCR